MGLYMQTRIHMCTHFQKHSKHSKNLGLPHFAEGVGAYGDGAPSVGANDVGA